MTPDHLQPELFTGEPTCAPTRNGYGTGLVTAGERDERVVALAADLTESTRTHLFAERFPERFVQVGVAEQNLASVASGMAAMGKIPFMASYAMFSPGRNWEQIRTTIAYNDVNVKIIGAHAGVSVGPDGATHQAVEDMAIMRVMPNVVVLAPADEHEAKRAVLAAAKYEGPVYIRLGRSATPIVTTEESPFAIGEAYELYTPKATETTPVGIIVTGSLLYNALQAAHALEAAGTPAAVLHVPTIKPFPAETVVAFAKRMRGLVTVEEHQRIGGLGGAVAEVLAEQCPTRIQRLGVNDVFGESGTPEELIAHHGMDTDSIVAAGEALCTATA